jgi:hypothetical protein
MEQEEVADLHEVAVFGQILDPIAAVEQNAGVAVDVGDGRLAARGGGEAGVVGEIVRLAIELADIDDLGPDGAFDERHLVRFARPVVGQGHRVPGQRLGRFRWLAHRENSLITNAE